MAFDKEIVVTQESLERAVSLMAKVMELPVPERELKLVRPQDLPPAQQYFTDTFMNMDEGYICLPHLTYQNTVFHEAAHWVLLNNGHGFVQPPCLFYGLIYDEVLAFLAQVTHTGSTNQPLFTKESVAEGKMRSRSCLKMYTLARDVNLEFLSRGSNEKKEEAEFHLATCVEEIAKSEAYILAADFIYWHYNLEEGWEDAFLGRRSWDDYMDELGTFHKDLIGKEPMISAMVTGTLAHRAAVAHYILNHKPQDLFNGLLKFGRESGQDSTFTYFQLTAKWARQLFEKKEVEEWMQQPRYLTR